MLPSLIPDSHLCIIRVRLQYTVLPESVYLADFACFTPQFLKTFIDSNTILVWHIRHVLMSDDGETEALLNEV